MKNKCNNLCNFFPTVIQLSVSYKNLIYNIEDGYAIFILLQMVSASWHMQSVLQISEYQNMQICTDLNLCSRYHLLTATYTGRAGSHFMWINDCKGATKFWTFYHITSFIAEKSDCLLFPMHIQCYMSVLPHSVWAVLPWLLESPILAL